jgi:hypothetical protein
MHENVYSNINENQKAHVFENLNMVVHYDIFFDLKNLLVAYIHCRLFEDSANTLKQIKRVAHIVFSQADQAELQEIAYYQELHVIYKFMDKKEIDQLTSLNKPKYQEIVTRLLRVEKHLQVRKGLDAKHRTKLRDLEKKYFKRCLLENIAYCYFKLGQWSDAIVSYF